MRTDFFRNRLFMGDIKQMQSEFLVPEISSLIGWYIGDDLSANFADEDAIFAWKDHYSGNTAYQEDDTITQRPVYKANIINDHGVARFDNATYSQNLILTNPKPSTKTAFIVAKKTATSNSCSVLYQTNTNVFNFPTPTSGNGQLSISEGTVTVYTHMVDATGLHILTARRVYSDTACVARVDGVEGFPANTANYWNISRIGYNGTRTSCFDGDIAEVILFSDILSDASVITIECYLSNKYGITFTGEMTESVLVSADWTFENAAWSITAGVLSCTGSGNCYPNYAAQSPPKVGLGYDIVITVTACSGTIYFSYAGNATTFEFSSTGTKTYTNIITSDATTMYLMSIGGTCSISAISCKEHV